MKSWLIPWLQYRHLIPAPVYRTSASACFYKHPWITCQKKAKHINGPCSLCIKATFSWEVIHASMPGWQPGVRLCIMPWLPAHLVQELNVSTVYIGRRMDSSKSEMVRRGISTNKTVLIPIKGTVNGALSHHYLINYLINDNFTPSGVLRSIS